MIFYSSELGMLYRCYRWNRFLDVGRHKRSSLRLKLYESSTIQCFYYVFVLFFALAAVAKSLESAINKIVIYYYSCTPAQEIPVDRQIETLFAGLF